jgi:hypothetical protein
MAKNDKEEFTCMVGEKCLVSWCLGESAGPGTTKVDSIDEWLDLWLDTPEEHFARYDGNEQYVTRIGRLATELNLDPDNVGFVAYRTN